MSELNQDALKAFDDFLAECGWEFRKDFHNALQVYLKLRKPLLLGIKRSRSKKRTDRQGVLKPCSGYPLLKMYASVKWLITRRTL